MKGDNYIPTIDTFQLERMLVQDGVSINILNRSLNNYFHINRLEDYHKIAGHSLKSDLQPRKLDVYSFFFITEGESTRGNGFDEFHFGANTFYFIPTYQITTFKSTQKTAKGFYCHFKTELLIQDTTLNIALKEFPFLEFNCFPLVKINEDFRVEIEFILERLLKEYNKDSECRIDILKTYLKTLFTEIKPFVVTHKPNFTSAADEITDRYKKALANHISEKKKVSDYAVLLNITPNHLNKSVKKMTNKTAQEFLEELLLLEAKILLKQTNLNITEIAYKIGRNELSDFVRFFKNKTGLRPSEFRLSKSE